MAIAVGQPAPEFTLKDQNENDVKLADFRGKNVVIVFYPADFSPTCTDEHACVVNDMKSFERLNAWRKCSASASTPSGRTRRLPRKWANPSLSAACRFQSAREPWPTNSASFCPTTASASVPSPSWTRAPGKVSLAPTKYDFTAVPDMKEVSDALAKLN